jgi:hypothetical protein
MRRREQNAQTLAVVDARPAADPGKFSHWTMGRCPNCPKKWGEKAGLLPRIHLLLPLSGLARTKTVADKQKRPEIAQM